MTQGVFLFGSRPKTKKQLKEQITAINEGGGDPYSVVIEATSLFGNEFDGSLALAKESQAWGPFYLVGPDPRTSRQWYASLEYKPKAGKWLLK